jgi:hypothetical protein
MAPLQQALAWYEGRLQARPLPTKQISSAAVAVVAEFICQRLSTHRGLLSPLNWRGLLQQLLIAFFMVAPMAHTWHGKLNAKFAAVPNGLRKVLAMVALEQSLFCPVINALFIAVNSRLQGLSWPRILAKLRESMPAVMKGSVGVWGTAGLVNYSMIRVEYRVLFGNLVGLGWTIWLLLRTHGQAKPTAVRAIALGCSTCDLEVYNARRQQLQEASRALLRRSSLSHDSLTDLARSGSRASLQGSPMRTPLKQSPKMSPSLFAADGSGTLLPDFDLAEEASTQSSEAGRPLTIPKAPALLS